MSRAVTLATQLRTSVRQIWSSYLGLDLEDAAFGLVEATIPIVRSQMRIQGEWDGCLCLEGSEALARQVAAVMFDAPREALSIEEVHDAWGEVTNMVSGCVKQALSPPVHLSLPATESIEVKGDMSAASRLSGGIGFIWKNEPFRVGILGKRFIYEDTNHR